MGLTAVSGFRLLLCGAAVMISVSNTLAQQQKKSSDDKKNLTDKGKGGFLWEHTPRSKDFHSIGHSLFLDLTLGPVKAYAPDTLVNPFDTLTRYSRIAEYSIYHISYFFRYNVVQPDDDRAFTLTINPGFGLGFSQSKRIKGFGLASGAAYIGYEWGNGSTYRTSEEKGAFIRLGAEYNYTPIFINSRDRVESDIKTWVGPAISFGTRRLNPKGRLVETNIKFGFGLNKVKEEGNAISPYTFSRPMSARFSLVFFLDY